MRVWCGMHKTLMKTVGGSELTPISHGISDVTPRSTAGRRNYSIPLHAESVRSRTFVLLFRINSEIAPGRRFRGSANRNGRRHQGTVALHYVDVFLRERNQNTHFRWVVWLVRSDVVWPARAHMPSCCTTGKQQERRANTYKNQSVNISHTSILDRIRQLFVNPPSAEAYSETLLEKTRRGPNSRIEGCQEGDFDCEAFVN